MRGIGAKLREKKSLLIPVRFYHETFRHVLNYCLNFIGKSLKSRRTKNTSLSQKFFFLSSTAGNLLIKSKVTENVKTKLPFTIKIHRLPNRRI